MRLYSTRSDLAFSLLQVGDSAGWSWRGGVPVEDRDTMPELLFDGSGASEFIPVDCFTLGSGVDGWVLSGYAKLRLEEILDAAGEFIPVRVMGHEYWWFNCLACVDALDRERTDADWGRVQGEWGSFMWITSTRRLEFARATLHDTPAMFRIPEYPQGMVLSTDRLRDAVTQSGLTGFQFDLVWTSESGGVAEPPGLGASRADPPEEPVVVARRRDEARRVLAARRVEGT